MKKLSFILFFLMVALCAGLVGIWISQNNIQLNMYNHHHSSNMHTLFHEKLNITAKQEKKLSVIEKEYTTLKNLYQKQIKVANLELAQEIKNNGYSSLKIKNIVGKIHKAMGDLQALSLKHLAQMEGILNEKQEKMLKELVIEQLHKNASE